LKHLDIFEDKLKLMPTEQPKELAFLAGGGVCLYYRYFQLSFHHLSLQGKFTTPRPGAAFQEGG
jgi:hypothetical protein